MTTRRLHLLSLLAAAILLVAGACSDNGTDEGADRTNTSLSESGRKTEVTTAPADR